MFSWTSRKLNIACIIAVIILLFPFGIDIYHAQSDKKAQEGFAPTDPAKVFIMDDANLLTDVQAYKLAKAMEPITSFMPVAFITTKTAHKGSTEEYTRSTLFPQTFTRSGILFVIDMYSRQLFIYTSDDNTKMSVQKCENITDNVYRYASKEQYYKCADETFEEIYKLMSGLAIPKPMKHTSNLLIALAVGLLSMFSGISKFVTVKKPKDVYKIDDNVRKKVALSNEKVVLTHEYTIHHDTSDSSGGFSGGFGGGGGVCGGGGGGFGGGHGF